MKIIKFDAKRKKWKFADILGKILSKILYEKDNESEKKKKILKNLI